MLTDSLIRVEEAQCSGSPCTPVFDDRPTLTVVNRMLPVPRYTVTHPNATAVVIKTDSLTITYEYGRGNRSTCAPVLMDTDENGGARVPSAPDGLSGLTQQQCCAACDKAGECTAWVWVPNDSGTDCYLMMGVTSVRKAKDRVFGGNIGGPALSGSLRIDFTVNGKPSSWTPGMSDRGNLNGTWQALDCYTTPAECNEVFRQNMQKGLLSRDGWAIVDDTYTSRFDDTEFRWQDNKFIDRVDWYFLGYGHRYSEALRDFTLISGKITMPPLSAFGVWWSRYWEYSEQSIKDEVLSGYKNYSLPLNHLVLDMDWHTEIKDPKCQTWGGYTWNTKLFPDPVAFTNWVHSSSNTVGRPLKLLLNVHPQTGVDHCQAKYVPFATAMGVNPATEDAVPCAMNNKSFALNLFSIILNPLNIDYWWTDYGGCGGNAALLWSNYCYDNNIELVYKRRPLVLSRYGGLGNHRYPIGFSGDTFQSDMTLMYLIRTTPTASNVLFGYWSHDVGGFHGGAGSGDADPRNITGSQLLLRWIQFAAVSPIFRTHCDHCERRIWLFPYFEHMRDAFYLRNALTPYIYTAAREAYDTGISLVRPMYYEAPYLESVYSEQYAYQYMFGPSIVAGPIGTMADQRTLLISKSVFLPPGTWVSWNGTFVTTTAVGEGVSLTYGLADIPLFVRASAIIPLKTMASVEATSPDPLVFVIFNSVAQTASTVVYEDDGDSFDYKTSRGALTNVTIVSNRHGDGASDSTVTIGPVVGGYAGMPASRGYQVQFRSGCRLINATVNGVTVPQGVPGQGTAGWWIQTGHSLVETQGAVTVATGSRPMASRTIVQVSWGPCRSL